MSSDPQPKPIDVANTDTGKVDSITDMDLSQAGISQLGETPISDIRDLDPGTALNKIAGDDIEAKTKLQTLKQQVREEIYQDITPPDTKGDSLSFWQREPLIRDVLHAESIYTGLERIFDDKDLSEEEQEKIWEYLGLLHRKMRGIKINELSFMKTGQYKIEDFAQTDMEKNVFAKVVLANAVTFPRPEVSILSLSQFVEDGIITDNEIVSTQNAMMCVHQDIRKAYGSRVGGEVLPRVYDIVRHSYDTAKRQDESNKTNRFVSSTTPLLIDVEEGATLRTKNGKFLLPGDHNNNIGASSPEQYTIEGQEVVTYDEDIQFQSTISRTVDTLNGFRDLQIALHRKPNFQEASNGLFIEPIYPQENSDTGIERTVIDIDSRIGIFQAKLEEYNDLASTHQYLDSVLDGQEIKSDLLDSAMDILFRYHKDSLPPGLTKERFLEAIKLGNPFTKGKYQKLRDELKAEASTYYKRREVGFEDDMINTLGIDVSGEGESPDGSLKVELSAEDKTKMIVESITTRAIQTIDLSTDLGEIIDKDEGTIETDDGDKTKKVNILEFSPSSYNANIKTLRERFRLLSGVALSLSRHYKIGHLGMSYDEQNGDIRFTDRAIIKSKKVEDINTSFIKKLAEALKPITSPEELVTILNNAYNTRVGIVTDPENINNISGNLRGVLPSVVAARFLESVGLSS